MYDTLTEDDVLSVMTENRLQEEEYNDMTRDLVELMKQFS